ncbi:uncharacterized protein ACB058_001743 [Synchiropus picturatus]
MKPQVAWTSEMTAKTTSKITLSLKKHANRMEEFNKEETPRDPNQSKHHSLDGGPNLSSFSLRVICDSQPSKTESATTIDEDYSSSKSAVNPYVKCESGQVNTTTLKVHSPGQNSNETEPNATGTLSSEISCSSKTGLSSKALHGPDHSPHSSPVPLAGSEDTCQRPPGCKTNEDAALGPVQLLEAALEQLGPGHVLQSSSPILKELNSSLRISPRFGSADPSPGLDLCTGQSPELRRNPGSAAGSTTDTHGKSNSPPPEAAAGERSAAMGDSHTCGIRAGGRGLTEPPETISGERFARWSPDDRQLLPLKKTGHQGALNTNINGTQAESHGSFPCSSSSPLRHFSAAQPTRNAAMVRRELDLRDVGVQVKMDLVDRSTSTTPSLSRKDSLVLQNNESSGVNASNVPPPCCVPGKPSSQHVCKIDIELYGKSPQPHAPSDKADSLPNSSNSIESDLGKNQRQSISSARICEEKSLEEETVQKWHQEKGHQALVRPQEVAWDEQGMTWEVYGASVDLESLGAAIQSHLESKIREQEKHIRNLRMSVCSSSSPKDSKMKKKRKGRGRFLSCWTKSVPADD